MNPSEVASLLKTADNILIVTHKRPDGDTVGCACALCHALRRTEKTAYIIDNPDTPLKYDVYCTDYTAPADFAPDFVVAVDVAAPDMVSNGASYGYDLVIDHHPSNPGFGRYNCICGSRSSCGEIVLDVIKELGIVPDKTEATLLYMAVSTDTGCFAYANANSDTFASASELIAYGAEKDRINLKFFRKVSKARIKLEGMIYSNIAYYRDGKIAVVKITDEMKKECGVTTDDLEDTAGLAGRVDTEVVGITITENGDGTSRVSLRSTPEVDSSAACAYFGGGGHKMAAGCTIEAGADKAEKLMLEVLDSLWTATS